MTRRELRALREAAEARSALAGNGIPSAERSAPLPPSSASHTTASAPAARPSQAAASGSLSTATAIPVYPASAATASDATDSGASTVGTRRHRDGKPPRAAKAPRRSGEKRRHRKWPYVLVLLVVLFGGTGIIATSLFGPVVSALLALDQPTDYEGEGTDQVQVVVKSGDTGSTIGDTLAAQGVVKTSSAFYRAVVRSGSEVVFQPGTYMLRKQMSATSALALLQSPSSRVQTNVTIPEGQTAAQAFELIAEGTGTPVADLKAAAADRASLGIPPQAPSIEGYLFPATYDFPPGSAAKDIVKTMVDRTFRALDKAGVAPADRHRVLTLAALIQKEARFEQDFYKVSRVFLNRISINMPLQSDATVAYGAMSTGRVTTTDAERADDNPYNTYLHPGLPAGPISNPGDVAIKAALSPADGPWLYFVTVNTLTGETVFSEKYEDHVKAVAQWQQFMKDNPGNG